MNVENYISKQSLDRQSTLAKIHTIVMNSDTSVKATVGLMMGKEMILYNAGNNFKYALSSVQKHISLHLMPMYVSPIIYSKYKALLPKAAFQKGCINFKTEEDMPLKIVERLMQECATIDLVKIREDYLKSKKR